MEDKEVHAQVDGAVSSADARESTVLNDKKPIVISTIKEMREVRRGLSGSVGVVPTMGYLHDGHLNLVRQARAANDAVVVTIFVNPTQFGPNEDFVSYPRDMQRDLGLLATVGADFVFAPAIDEMYRPGSCTKVMVEGIEDTLEGAHRPGHFRGVATVVTKLLNIVQPTNAYFGQKDAQQTVVIKRLVNDLDMDTNVVIVPTKREVDGVAMSSRNTYLKPDERAAAVVLYKALCAVKKQWENGEQAATVLRQTMRSTIESEPLATLEYVSLANPETLVELETVEGPALASMAVRIGRTRLIDNIILRQP